MSSKWQNYGCPPRPFQTPSGFFQAMRLAILERWQAASRSYIQPQDLSEVRYFGSRDPGLNMCVMMDESFSRLWDYYLVEDPSFQGNDPQRYRAASLESCAAVLGETLIRPHVLHPAWSWKWARQRYRFVNLIQYTVTYYNPPQGQGNGLIYQVDGGLTTCFIDRLFLSPEDDLLIKVYSNPHTEMTGLQVGDNYMHQPADGKLFVFENGRSPNFAVYRIHDAHEEFEFYEKIF